MDKYVITIAREFGSLGRPIAMKMAELLQIDFYDRDIVEVTAKNMNLPVSVIGDIEEKATSKDFFGMKFPLGNKDQDTQDKIFEEQTKVIQEVSEKESCIIVGRCSDYILRNNKNCIKIFIYAPYEERLKNSIDVLHLEREKAKRMIEQVDKAREGYHRKYAGFSQSDSRYKDIMIDSSLLGIEGTAEVLVDIVKKKFDIK